MRINKPVFIIGIGRSGSTVFFDILSRHPEVVWLSQRICNRYPYRPELNRHLMRFINLPVAGRILRRLFEPGECYPYWNTLYRGFGTTYRDLHNHDVTNRAKDRIRRSLGKMLTSEKDRLLVKITGWNRIGFLNEIFPDARFIYVQRDPRAVINSLMNVYFWSGWKGPYHLLKQNLTDEQNEELMKFDYSYVALAGMEVEQYVKAYNEAKLALDADRLLEVDYESLCNDPVKVYRDACEFCGLGWHKRFENDVRASRLKNTNYKWKQDLTDEQQKIADYYFKKLNQL